MAFFGYLFKSLLAIRMVIKLNRWKSQALPAFAIHTTDWNKQNHSSTNLTIINNSLAESVSNREASTKRTMHICACACMCVFADHADSAEILYINEMIMALKLMRKAPTHLKPHSTHSHNACAELFICRFGSVRFDWNWRNREAENQYTQRKRKERKNNQRYLWM